MDNLQVKRSETAMPMHDGGSGGGRSSSNAPRYYAVGDTYMTNTMPISGFNNDPYRNSGIVKGYGQPGGGGVTWSGGGGGGAGQVGYDGVDNGPPTSGNGGYGMIFSLVLWCTRVPRWWWRRRWKLFRNLW